MSASQTCAAVSWTQSEGHHLITTNIVCVFMLWKTRKQTILTCDLQVGMTTDEIDFIVHQETIKHSAYPSPLEYGGFPKSVCTSVNNVVCHGIPDR